MAITSRAPLKIKRQEASTGKALKAKRKSNAERDIELGRTLKNTGAMISDSKESN